MEKKQQFTIEKNGFSIKDNIIHVNFLENTNPNDKIIFQKRNTNIKITFPVIESTSFFIDYEMPFSGGIWDVFVSSKSKKIRVACKSEFDKLSNFIFCKYTSYSVLPYKTVHGNFSLILSRETAKTEISSVEIGEKHTILSLILDKSFENMSFQLIHRKTFETIPVSFEKRVESSNVLWDLFIPNNLILGFWDLYLCDQNGNKIDLFIEENGSSLIYYNMPMIDNESCILKCYRNKRKGISFLVKRLNIIRDIYDMSLRGDIFQVKGVCMVDGISFSKNYKRELIVIHRESKKTQKFNLPYINIQNTYHDDTIDIDTYQKSGFSIKISLMDLQKKFGFTEGIFDFILTINTGDKIFQGRLGSKRYVYKKDLFKAYSKKMTIKGFREFYLSYTPAGNIKIQQMTTNYFWNFIAFLSPLLYYFFFKKKDIWIIGERPNTAQDTGYHLFKYCRTKFPEKHVYYAIDKNSKDIKNILPYGNILYLGTFRHYLYSLMATTIISSHDNEYFLPFKGFRFHTYRRANKVFLQHGVLGRKHAEYDSKYYKYPFNLFCVSSNGEKKMVCEKMGYPKKKVVVTGLSRFDELNLNPKVNENPTILLIPTWREWLNSDEKFISSEYYSRYQSLLNHPILHKILEKYNANLVFYPHYRSQPFIELFNVSNNPRIRIVKLGEENVQDLFKMSDIMITDFSSVSFDFSYMNKPVLFYHFDFQEFFKKGILRPVEETFLGDICNSEEEIFNELESLLKNGCREKSWVKDKKHLIFKHVDHKNCERIYEAIVKENKRIKRKSLIKKLLKAFKV